jgi:hypothetical protein
MNGLTEDVLRDAIGETHKNYISRVNDLHPPSAAGLLTWIMGTEALRQRLLPHGWRYSNARNYPVTVSPDYMTTIVINSGDEETGIEDGVPSTVSRKGQATKDAVDEDNKNQLHFDLEDVRALVEQDERSSFWILLTYVADDEIRLELSRPATAVKHQPINDWLERIILSPIPLAPSPDFEEEPFEEYDVPVKRRSQ